MPDELPSFLRPSQAPAPAPDFLAPRATPVPGWLTAAPRRDPNPRVPSGNPPEVKEMLLEQFKLFFPRVLDRMCAGETLNKVLEEFPMPIDRGAFMRWVSKDPERHAQFKEAKTIRTDIWAGEMIDIAEGSKTINGMQIELDRGKFLVDTYKFLIKAENKREYGDTKQVEINQNISIVGALQQASTRVERYIGLQTIGDTDDDDPVLIQLSVAQDEEDDREDDDE